MSLMSTLAKVAIGIAVAKKIKGMTGGGSVRKQGGGLNDILGELTRKTQGGGGSGGMFDDLARSTAQNQGQSGGGLNDILGKLTKGAGNQGGGLSDILGGGRQTQNSGASGGLESILGGILGGAAKPGQSGGLGGGLGGLLEKLAPKTGAASAGTGGLGDLLNQAMNKYGEPEAVPTPEQNNAAGVLLSVMLQAAKSDGQIDASEKEALFKNLGEISPEEMEFVNQQLVAPVDPQGLAATIPDGMQQQAYMMSLVAIDLDNQKEANYLHTFASALGLGQSEVNAIHQEMSEPLLYS